MPDGQPGGVTQPLSMSLGGIRDAAVYRGAESIAREQGYLMYSGSTDRDPAREEGLALAMCARRVDGLIIIPAPGSHDYLVSEIEAGVATVSVLHPPELAGADAVMPDERGAAQAAIAHLAGHGHRRIGLVGRPAGAQRWHYGTGTWKRWRRPAWRPIPRGRRLTPRPWPTRACR